MRFLTLVFPLSLAALGLPRPAIHPHSEPAAAQTFTVRNRLNLDRRAETISLPARAIGGLLRQYGAANLLVRNAAGTVVVSQAVDTNGDGTPDELLLQTDIKALATQTFTVTGAANSAARQPKSRYTTYSRLVPERIDDYTWENDRVAFRTYGPKAQQLTEAGSPDGTLSSGIDCWLKRVPYSIIDKWYAGHVQAPGYYHIDHGEGYDPYHVGASRGVAGIGVWDQDSLFVSRNFTSCRTLATGPIRTLFELTYAPWPAASRTVTEKKRISLDLGSNLARFEERIGADAPLPNVAVGTTLHAGAGGVPGQVRAMPAEGWFRYWEPMNDSFLGTGVVLAPARLRGWQDRRTKAPDQSHLLVLTAPQNGRLVYYAGFGWTKSGQFATVAAWDQYLANYAKRLASPLEISLLRP